MIDIPQEVRDRFNELLCSIYGIHDGIHVGEKRSAQLILAAQLPIAPATEAEHLQFYADWESCDEFEDAPSQRYALECFISRRNSPKVLVDPLVEYIITTAKDHGVTLDVKLATALAVNWRKP